MFSFLVLVMFGYIFVMPPVISYTVERASRRTDLPAKLDDIPRDIIRFALEDITVDGIRAPNRRWANSPNIGCPPSSTTMW